MPIKLPSKVRFTIIRRNNLKYAGLGGILYSTRIWEEYFKVCGFGKNTLKYPWAIL